MNDRDMYYNTYGYGGFTPNNMMMGGIPPVMNPNITNQTYTGMPNQTPLNNTYASGQFNDMNERLARLERQVKRLDQRLTRLETPYANTNNYPTEPDNNMYMM